MRPKLAAAACTLLLTNLASAQMRTANGLDPALRQTGSAPGDPRGPGGPPSTVVHADGSATFTLHAPSASDVRLTAGYPIIKGGGMGIQADRGLPMRKDAGGDWSITVGPLAPEFYEYGFSIDSASVADPRAAFMQGNHSVLIVHGPAIADYELNPVPHGTVAQVWYDAPSFGGARRRITVYTPPGYEQSHGRYPVLYLLHGGGGDELSWNSSGRASAIFDNLISQGRMVPAIVVMPNGGNGGASVAPRDATLPGGPPPGQGGPDGPDRIGLDNPRIRFVTSLMREIVPFIDRTYRTRADHEHRAVAGQSGGGGEAMIAAINNPGTFAWLGAFSPGWPDVPAAFWTSIPRPADADLRRGPEVGRSIDPGQFRQLVPVTGTLANRELRLFYFGVGDADGLVETEQAIRGVLDHEGVRYVWAGKHDYGHDWALWRMNLKEFATMMFKPAR